MKLKKRLQRDYREITERLQRDYREITERLQRDYGEITERLQRDYREITERLQGDYREIEQKQIYGLHLLDAGGKALLIGAEGHLMHQSHVLIVNLRHHV